jgi:hypothetical protein
MLNPISNSVAQIIIQALTDAHHALVTRQGCIATDRPDLVSIPEDISWVMEDQDIIKDLDDAINLVRINTALIDTAPEMLEALKGVSEAFEEAGSILPTTKQIIAKAEVPYA